LRPVDGCRKIGAVTVRRPGDRLRTKTGASIERKETPMNVAAPPILQRLVVSIALALVAVSAGIEPAGAVDAGDPAPDFTLPSTTGVDISLRDFRGKNFVLLEFYGADFSPT
jgi:AhpC/TSA family protein